MRTHGGRTHKQCHPFNVISREKNNDADDAWFVHNGVITVDTQGDESDTMAFNRILLRPMFKDFPQAIKNASVQVLIKKYIGDYNKLVFMHGAGEVTIINKQAGFDHEGCWVSNKSSFSDYNESWRGNQNNANDKYLGRIQLKQGDIVHIFHKKEAEFYALGRVSSDNTSNSTDVDFIDKEGKEQKRSYFLNVSGECNNPPGYFMVPENSKLPNIIGGMTVEDWLSKFVNSDEPVVEEKKTQQQNDSTKTGAGKKKVVEEATTQTTTTGTAKFTMAQIVKAQMSVDQAPCSKIGPLASGIQECSIDPNMVTWGNLQFNSKDDRWGGACLTDADAEYGPLGTVTYTIRDLYYCSAQDRFNFFRQCPRLAFAIFEDLIEKVTLDTIEEEDGLDSEVAEYEREILLLEDYSKKKVN